MTFKLIFGKIHLWLGMISGLLVFIIAITGALYAFKEEIQDLTQPYRFVKPAEQNFLPPSVLKSKADKFLPGKHVHAVLYKDKTRAAQVIYYSGEEKYYYITYVNPYSGEVLHVSDINKGFFHFILDGHFYLWLPDNIGQPVVASATLIFVVMMISGIYLWYKRKKVSLKDGFKIKWNARWRRRNYDLHNVLGIYVTAIALIFAVTGLVWGFEWFANTYYKVASGGKDFIPYYEPHSDTTQMSLSEIPATDKVWLKMVKEYPQAEAIEVHLPETKSSPIAANANFNASTYWKTDFRYFDQYTLKELDVKHMYGRLADASKAQLLMRMNYDIHVGAVFGLAGKIVAFFASLLIASLPVTGVLIWWGRKRKEKKTSFVKKYKLVEEY